MKAKKFFSKKLLFDSAMIIFSVLLALLIDEWRSSYNQDVLTEKLLQSIKKEIIDNQKFVKETITYQEEVLAEIRKAYTNDSLEKTFFSTQYGFVIGKVAPNGVHQGDMYDIAWTVAKESKITNRISLEKSKALFLAYEQHNSVEDAIATILYVVNSRESLKKENLKESVTLYLTGTMELIGRLNYLDYLYVKALKALENK